MSPFDPSIGDDSTFFHLAEKGGGYGADLFLVWAGPMRRPEDPFIGVLVAPGGISYLTLEQVDSLARELTRRVTDEKVARAQAARGWTAEDL
jgi:hypothetical protein